MREILFRGKRTDNGEWVYGNYAHTDCYIKHNDYIGQNNPLEYMVNPETVGQYTGLTDKNGKKIFEGDILKEKQSNQALIFTVDWCEDCAMFVTPCKNFKSLEFDFTTSYGEQFEIIGNVFDNSDLLKGE